MTCPSNRLCKACGRWVKGRPLKSAFDKNSVTAGTETKSAGVGRPASVTLVQARMGFSPTLRLTETIRSEMRVAPEGIGSP